MKIFQLVVGASFLFLFAHSALAWQTTTTISMTQSSPVSGGYTLSPASYSSTVNLTGAPTTYGSYTLNTVCIIPYLDRSSYTASGGSNFFSLGVNFTTQVASFSPSWGCQTIPASKYAYQNFSWSPSLGAHTIGTFVVLGESTGVPGEVKIGSMVVQDFTPVSFTVVSTLPPSPCGATTISGCSLPYTSSGGTAGSCSSGYTGSCSYTCTNGNWSRNSNSCVSTAPPPPSGTTAIIVLPSPNPYSSTSGSSVTFFGYGSGGWPVNYEWRDGSCTAGTFLSNASVFSLSSLSNGSHTIYFRVQDLFTGWSSCANTRVNVAGNAACTATTIGNCDLLATASGGVSGTCSPGYAGYCAYTCTNGTWSANSNSCAGLADLTAGNTAAPASGMPGQSQSFSASVSNIGVGTAYNFPNVFQIADSAITTTIARVSTGIVASLAPSASTGISGAYTFSSPGSYNVRACANMNTLGNTVVTESNANNNCGAWQSLAIAWPALSASCSGTPGNPYTGQAVTWSSSVPSGTGSYTYSWSGTDGLSGSTASVSKTYSTVGQKSATVTVTDTKSGQVVSASCSTGANQPNGPTNGGTCTSGVCPGTCTASLSASPATVEQGQNTALSWGVTGGASCAASCSGNGFSTGGAVSGSVAASVPPAPPTTSYGLSCAGGTYGPPPAVNTTVTVLVPTAAITANGQSTTARVNSTTANNTNVVWTSTNSASCSVTKNGAAWKTGLSGNVTESVTAQTFYKIDCVNNHGTHAAGTVQVNILPAYQKF